MTKKLTTVFLVLVLAVTLFGCAKQTVEAPEVKPEKSSLRAVFITAYPLGNDFIDMIWDGFLQLESEGWGIQKIEAMDPVEYEEDIRAMAADGYDVIMLFGAEIIKVAVDLSDELYAAYPEMHMFFLDYENKHDIPNGTSVTVDPFESSFVAGYVAAMTSETKTVGVIIHSDAPILYRFSNGYFAGIQYADNDVKGEFAISGSPVDVTMAYEAAKSMIANYPVDIIYQVGYTAGTGIIQACAEAGIRCIGVDDWQGYINDSVFWSALKPIDLAVTGMGHLYKEGAELPSILNFNIASGSDVYDKRDLEKLPAELQAKVLQLEEDIKNGKVDVYANYPDYKLDY